VNRYLLLVLALSACDAQRSAPAPRAPDPEPAPWPSVEVAPVPELRTETRPLPRDIAAMRRPSQVQISPDGERLAYVVSAPTFDPDAEPSEGDTSGGWKTERQLWLVAREDGTPRRLTHGEASVSSPRFAPDGRSLAFVRRHEGKAKLFVLPLDGGEARPVDLGKHSPDHFAWSPDGRRFAFLAEEPRSDEEKEARWRRGGARRFDREWRRKHLMVVDASGGEAVHVYRGEDSVVSFEWAPDGQSFAVVTAASTNPYEAWLRHRLRIVSAADGSTIAEVETEPASIQNVAWSPDGARLAYERATEGESLSLHDALRVLDVGEGTKRDLGEGLDASHSGFFWTSPTELVAVIQSRTRTVLQRLPLNGAPRIIEHGAPIL